MAHVVVMCPRCRVALIADDDHETTGCNRCGRRLTLAELRVFHASDDHAAAVRVAGAVNARQAGDLDAFLAEVDEPVEVPETPMERALAEASSRSGKQAVTAALLALAEEVEVTPDRAAELLSRLDADPESAEEHLARLADRGELYEPRPGAYRRPSAPG